MDFFNNLRLFLSLRAVVLAEKPLFFKELLEDAKRSGDVDELKDLFIEMPPIPE